MKSVIAIMLGVPLFFGWLAAMDAKRKGYSPFLWFMGGAGLFGLGFLVEITLKSSLDDEATELVRQKRLRTGNVIGCALGCIYVIESVFVVWVLFLGGTA